MFRNRVSTPQMAPRQGSRPAPYDRAHRASSSARVARVGLAITAMLGVLALAAPAGAAQDGAKVSARLTCDPSDHVVKVHETFSLGKHAHPAWLTIYVKNGGPKVIVAKRVRMTPGGLYVSDDGVGEGHVQGASIKWVTQHESIVWHLRSIDC